MDVEQNLGKRNASKSTFLDPGTSDDINPSMPTQVAGLITQPQPFMGVHAVWGKINDSGLYPRTPEWLAEVRFREHHAPETDSNISADRTNNIIKLFS